MAIAIPAAVDTRASLIPPVTAAALLAFKSPNSRDEKERISPRIVPKSPSRGQH